MKNTITRTHRHRCGRAKNGHSVWFFIARITPVDDLVNKGFLQKRHCERGEEEVGNIDVCCCVGVLVCWCAGVLVCWRAGVLVCWCAGVLVCRRTMGWMRNDAIARE